MASLQLIDTGYLNKTRTGTVESSIANSGSAVSLTNTVSLRFRHGNNVDSTPEPGTGQTVDAQLISFENRRIDVIMELMSDNSTHREILKDIVGVKDNSSYPGFIETNGIKALYISGTSDSKKSLIELFGSTNTNFHSNEIGSGLPAILGFVEDLTVDNSGESNKIVLRFTFKEA